MITINLKEEEYNPYYGRYINKLPQPTNLIDGFMKGEAMIVSFFKSIPANKLTYRYKPNKWSIKEVFQHLIDTERLFIYRCFRIARNDKTSLAGFDQNIYIAPSNADKKSIEALTEEFSATRKSSISLLSSLSETDLKNIGNANGGAMSARVAAFIIIGHEIWHLDIIKERYL